MMSSFLTFPTPSVFDSMSLLVMEGVAVPFACIRSMSARSHPFRSEKGFTILSFAWSKGSWYIAIDRVCPSSAILWNLVKGTHFGR